MITRKQTNIRRGATAVEFAIVFPIAMMLIFGLIELSRWYQLSGVSTTAILQGGREASIVTSQRSDVENQINELLGISGINDVNIVMTPEELDSTVSQVQLRIEIPITMNNGFFLSQFYHGQTFAREIQVNRL